MAAIGQVVRNPAILNQQLEAELQGINAKTCTDNLWFEVDDNAQLILRERPLDCLAIIWEFLVRLFTDKLTRLEQKFESITLHVAEYLRVENDPQRLGEFLNRHTLAINELYRCAAKMQRAHRISQDVLNHMQAHPEINDLVITELDEAGRAPAYLFRGIVTVVNSRKEHCSMKLRFANEQRKLEQELSKEQLVTGKTYRTNFVSAGSPNSVHAEITHEKCTTKNLALSTPFRTACKLAVYQIEAQEDGQFHIGIIPLKIARLGETIHRMLVEGENVSMLCEQDLELATFQVPGVRVERNLLAPGLKWETSFTEQFNLIFPLLQPQRVAEIQQQGIQIETRRDIVVPAI